VVGETTDAIAFRRRKPPVEHDGVASARALAGMRNRGEQLL
jgi:hypothetical protein